MKLKEHLYTATVKITTTTVHIKPIYIYIYFIERGIHTTKDLPVQIVIYF